MRRLFLLSPVLLIAGCSGPTLTGQWSGKVPLTVVSVDSKFDFKADGTWTGTFTTGEISTPMLSAKPMTATANGTWSIKGDDLILGSKDEHVTSSGVVETALAPMVESGLHEAISRYAASKIKFGDKTAVIKTDTAGELVLTRESK